MLQDSVSAFQQAVQQPTTPFSQFKKLLKEKENLIEEQRNLEEENKTL